MRGNVNLPPENGCLGGGWGVEGREGRGEMRPFFGQECILEGAVRDNKFSWVKVMTEIVEVVNICLIHAVFFPYKIFLHLRHSLHTWWIAIQNSQQTLIFHLNILSSYNAKYWTQKQPCVRLSSTRCKRNIVPNLWSLLNVMELKSPWRSHKSRHWITLRSRSFFPDWLFNITHYNLSDFQLHILMVWMCSCPLY